MQRSGTARPSPGDRGRGLPRVAARLSVRGAMSRANVEVVRQAWEAYARRDNEAAFALYHAEVELQSGIDGRVYRGLDGVREMFRDWLGVWNDYGTDVDEWVDAGDHVIAVVRSWGRGKHSTVPVELTEAHLWTLRNGKLWRLRIFPTKTEALEAVGLSE